MSDSVWFHRDKIFELLSKWPNSHSLTPDYIPFRFLREIALYISSPLEYIFNLSFMNCEIPQCWKISFVTPIPKKVSTPSPRSFRPVSITSILARVFEKILKSVIVNHLETCAVIPPQQHGFRTGRSTVTQMLET